MLMLGVDTVLKLAVMKQTTHPLLTSLFVRIRFSFLPSSGAKCVPPLRNVHTGFGTFVPFIQPIPRAAFQRVRPPEHKADHLPPPYPEIQNEFSCVCLYPLYACNGQLDTAHPSRQVNDSEGIFQQCDSARSQGSFTTCVVFGAERRNVTRSVVTVQRIECNSDYCSCLIGAAGWGRGGGSHDHELHG
jgi:hypothetical protein